MPDSFLVLCFENMQTAVMIQDYQTKSGCPDLSVLSDSESDNDSDSKSDL